MKRIVVAVDGSSGSANALRWAVTESGHRGVPVVGVMTWGWLDQHHPGGGTDFEPEYDATTARVALDSFVDDALGEDAAATVERHVINDVPATGLLEFTEDTDLLVLGARGLGGFRGLLLGSVSQACLHRAACPVAIVRQVGEPDHDPERIVVGVDGSSTSLAALSWALDEARGRRARLDVIHAWSAPFVMGYSYGAVVNMAEFEDAARLMVENAVGRSDTHGLIQPMEQIVVADGPSAALLDSSKDADLLVVGSRGVGGFRGMLLGSVSHQVAQHAECPVVVIPPKDDAR